MVTAIMSGYALSLAAPAVHRVVRRWSGWIIALLPAGLFAYFLSLVGRVAGGEVIVASYEWFPSLGYNLTFYFDGLSLLFALIVTGIGTLVIVYAGSYLAGDPWLGRFYAIVLIFMASMLGGVIADNLIALFVFWELTSISSYLLIGYKFDKAASRAAALQALLVTGGGGLALLVGLLLLGLIGGSWEISALLGQAETIQAHHLYLPALLLILAGAFTKSAQFPFHFWLPGAMEAPAPVSAYLHSATMVKAGVFLLARLSPALGGTDEWTALVTSAGAVTMFLGGFLAWKQTDLKRILAYSTVSTLGTLVLLLGIGSSIAVKGAAVLLLAHAMYKGSLFLMAGGLDHETGTRDITAMGGLARSMPVSMLAASLAALSMAGLPPLVGFISKEVLYEATLEDAVWPALITAVAVAGNVFVVAAAGLVAIKPFWGEWVETPKHPHEGPVGLWLGPVLLAGLGLFVGLAPGVVSHDLIAPAASAVLQKETTVKLALWHGINPMLVLSVITVGLGVAAYVWRERLGNRLNILDPGSRFGPARIYQEAVDGLPRFATAVTSVLQSGYLRLYLTTIVVVTVGLVGFTLASRVDAGGMWRTPDVRIYEILVAGMILAGALGVTLMRSRMASVAALGTVGYGIALLYVLFSAPDLAMTQFAIETLTVLLFVFVIYRLPKYATLTSRRDRVRDAVVALLAGAMMTTLVLIVTAEPLRSRLTPYFAENSLPLGKGRNIVNVILVDFRAFDTLGEITVLSVAAIGVYALMKLRLGQAGDEES